MPVDLSNSNDRDRRSGEESTSDIPSDLFMIGKEPPLDRVGPYKILRWLGSGGLSEVWLAERSAPFRQRVALKMFRSGMLSKRHIARFECVQNVLGNLNHPNVVKILDAGTTETGAPYHVMEYIDGKPITRYCDERSLPINERLELFIPVCEAVHFLHHNFVAHRDIKPVNVLVVNSSVSPTPKLIGFSIAKIIRNPALLESDKLEEDEEQMIEGTVGYMSPEQVRPERASSSSDIYSLGILLYELVTTKLPIDRELLLSGGIRNLARNIQNSKPLAVSERRGIVGPKSIDDVVLDAIVAKALRLEPTRRYDSAQQFADSIREYLQDRPVTALDLGNTYAIEKFVHRNAGRLLGPVVATLGVLAALTAISPLDGSRLVLFSGIFGGGLASLWAFTVGALTRRGVVAKTLFYSVGFILLIELAILLSAMFVEKDLVK